MEIDEKHLKLFFEHIEDYSHNDICWIWKLSKDKDGYGYFSINGKTLKAHRVSYIIHYGEIKEGMHILHSCDNPSCVNPSHLRQGDEKENAKDREERNSKYHPKGKDVYNAKFNNEQILEIRSLYSSGKYNTVEIGRIYGCSHKLIHQVS